MKPSPLLLLYCVRYLIGTHGVPHLSLVPSPGTIKRCISCTVRVSSRTHLVKPPLISPPPPPFSCSFLGSRRHTGSYFADAVSGNHVLEETHFEDMHTYRLDWQPFEGENGEKPYLRWYLDDEQLYGINSDTLVRRAGGWVGVGVGWAALGQAGLGMCGCLNQKEPPQRRRSGSVCSATSLV